MKANDSSIVERTRKALFCYILSITYCWIPSSPTNAQVKELNPKTVLPLVSQEVYQTITQFYEYDRNIPLNAKIISKQELPEGNREKIVFTGVDNSIVPAYLITPKDGASPRPVVLIIDGITGSKERWFDDNSWPKGGLVTKALLKNGFAVMVLDAVYHGERTVENDYVTPPWPHEYPYKARHMFINTAIEHRRAIDYLSTRTDIDTTKIGMLGLSMGGLITFAITSIDSRVKSAIAGLTPIWKDKEFEPWLATTFATHVESNSFLMFMGNKDGLYTMKEARQLYDMIPIAKKEFVEYDSGHELQVEYVTKVSEWFLKNLKP